MKRGERVGLPGQPTCRGEVRTSERTTGLGPRTVWAVGGQTRLGVLGVRHAIATFRSVPVVVIASNAILFAFALASGSPTLGPFPPTAHAATGTNATTVGAVHVPTSDLAGLVVGTVLGLLVLGISFVAWWRWRRALATLGRGREEYGAGQGRMVRRSRWVFYAVTVSGVVYVVFAEILNYAVLGAAQQYGQDVASGLPAATLAGAAADLNQAVLDYTVTTWLILVVMLSLAAVSLRLSILGISSVATRARLNQGLALMVGGVFLLGLQLLYLLNPWLAFLTVVGDAIVLFGLIDFHRAYGLWLQDPAKRGPAARQ